MPAIRKTEPTTGKTIVLVATIVASTFAIVSLALIEPPTDTEIPNVSFDVAPPAAQDRPQERPSSPTLLSAVGVRPVASRTANERWSADESSGGTRPDAMH